MNERVSMTHRHAVCLLAAVLALAGGCDESLPTYAPPADILSVSVRPLNAVSDTVRYTMQDNNNPNLVRVTMNSLSHGYEIMLVNRYEETIQDDLEIDGTLELAWREKPELTAVLPLSNTAFFDGGYDPSTRLLTINPGDTVRLRVYWNFRLATTEWAFTQTKYTDGPSYFTGPLQSASDRIHAPMALAGTVKVKLLRSLSFTEARTEDDIVVNFKGRVLNPP